MPPKTAFQRAGRRVIRTYLPSFWAHLVFVAFSCVSAICTYMVLLWSGALLHELPHQLTRSVFLNHSPTKGKYRAANSVWNFSLLTACFLVSEKNEGANRKWHVKLPHILYRGWFCVQFLYPLFSGGLKRKARSWSSYQLFLAHNHHYRPTCN